MINSLDLTLSAIKGIPEKIPFNPYIMHLAASLSHVDYNHDFCQKPEILANAMIKCSDFFGIDHVNVSTDAYREAHAWGVEMDWSSHTPVAQKHLNIDDFMSLEPPDLSDDIRIQNRVKAVKLLYDKVGGKQCIIGWIEAPLNALTSLFGLVNVLMECRKSNWEEILIGLVERILPIEKEFAKMQIEAGADIIGAGDSAISQIGPMRYEKCFLKGTKELVKYIQSNVPVLYHTCGDNGVVDKEGRDMLKFISSSNADIIDLDYQVDLRIAKEKIGKKNCIRGNTNTLIVGSPEYTSTEVINAITNTIEIGKQSGMYMYAAGCEWPWEPLEMASRNLGLAKALTEKMGVY